jgi:choline dehydrogenase-like flavoprotein
MSGFVDATASAPVDEEVDYVIVGSGAGGGAAARVLARSGARVLVLEEGPYVPASSLATPAMQSTAARLFRNQGKQLAFGRATTPILQGRCVGGTTFVNSAIVWRIPSYVLAGWQRELGLVEWTDAALDDASARIESEMSVRPVIEGETANRQDQLLRDAARAANVEGRFIHRYEQGCRGSGRCWHGCPNDAKQSTTINYLRRAAEDGATIVSSARVTRVLFDGERAIGVAGRVVGSGVRFRVRARRAVVISASAVQSPNLLRRSGVRLPALGEGFMAHPGTTVMGVYPDRVNMWRGASQGYEVLGWRHSLGIKCESINVPPEVVASRLPGVGARLQLGLGELGRVAAWAIAVKAEARGRVRPSLWFGDHVRYDLTDRDVERFRSGMKKLAELHFLAGAERVILGIHGLPEVLHSLDHLSVFDRAPLDPLAYNLVMTHLFGGCCAGRDSASSVVDAHLKVHGRERLYVMDASVFPSNTGVNPQHGIMALATVAAERLAAS